MVQRTEFQLRQVFVTQVALKDPAVSINAQNCVDLGRQVTRKITGSLT